MKRTFLLIIVLLYISLAPWFVMGCEDENTGLGETCSGVCGDDIFWSVDTAAGLLTVSGTGIMYDPLYDSPWEIPWSEYRDLITSVLVEAGVTGIGTGAFERCTNLISVTLPEGLTTIGACAFSNCARLLYITIPEGVTEIPDSAFYACENLTSVTIPDSVRAIGQYAFYGCADLQSFTIPEGVTDIGRSTFYGCRSLASVAIPEGVTDIGCDAFYGCKKLGSVTIPASVKRVGDCAFECSGLWQVYFMGDAPSDWGENIFHNVSGEFMICYPKSAKGLNSPTFEGYLSVAE
jgi:hypothetical protein